MSESSGGEGDPKLVFNVTTLYGYHLRTPRVQMSWPQGDVTSQMSIPEARDLAFNLLQACESAIQDAFIFEWVQSKLDATEYQATMIMQDYRTWRKEKQHDAG